MSEIAPTPPAPPPAKAPVTPSLGGLLELAFFLVAVVVLLLVVHLSASVLLALYLQPRNPGLAWQELFSRVLEENQFNAFFLVPVQVTYYGLLVLLLYGLVRARGALGFWAALSVRRVSASVMLPMLAGGILLALFVNMASLLVPPPEPLPFEKLFTSRAAALLVLGASLLVAPVVEELIFRGYIYALLERAGGAASAVIVSGVLFGSIHFFQLWPGYFQIVLLCVVGVTFSLARARTGTTTASMLMHLSYNATLSLGYLFSSQFHQLSFFLS